MAGGKAKTDIELIMHHVGYKNIALGQSHHANKIVDFILTFSGVMKALLTLRRNDELVLQYPVKKYYRLICRTAHRKGARTVTLIHDLGSFRRKKLTVEGEIEKLNLTDVVIAHNVTMISWLKDKGCKAQLLPLGIFDYITPGVESPQYQRTSDKPFSVFFVGDLSSRKNKFLYLLADESKNMEVNAYGGHFDESMACGHIVNRGYARDTDLIMHCDGDFGLSWYGDSLSLGDEKDEYIHYNNPHKVSLYLRCCRPVITWSKAGLAQFVTDNGIGICVDSLEHLEERLQSVTADEYQQMLDNVQAISRKLSTGYFTKQVLDKATDTLQAEAR